MELRQDGNQGDCTTATACYFYNALGQRVSKFLNQGTSTLYYVYGSDGEVVADTDANQNWNETYIHFGGQLVAQYRGSATGFLIKDHLSSTRLDTLYPTPTVYDNMDFLPYGEQIEGGTATVRQFTNYERDTETGLDNAQARYYNSKEGRFMTPDPGGMYVATALNPQSWNMYAYALNNPMKFRDPSGLDPCDDDPSCGGDGGDPWGGWGGGSGGGNGPTYGGPIWTEQIPIYTGPPIDSSLIIVNLTQDGGCMAPGEGGYCGQGPGLVLYYWDPKTQTWGTKPPPKPPSPIMPPVTVCFVDGCVPIDPNPSSAPTCSEMKKTGAVIGIAGQTAKVGAVVPSPVSPALNVGGTILSWIGSIIAGLGLFGVGCTP